MMIQHLWHDGEPLCGNPTARPYGFNTIAESNDVPVCTRCHRLSLHRRDRGRYVSHLTPTRWWARAYAFSFYWSLVLLAGIAAAIAATAWRIPSLIYVSLGIVLFSIALRSYHSESTPTDPRPGEAAAGAALLVAGAAVGVCTGVYLATVLP